jgi:asparagine synthetase B (glutamine-hydrolysing)
MMLARTSGQPIDLAVQFKQMLGSGTLAELGLLPADVGLRVDFLPDDLRAQLADAGDDPFLAVSRVETYVYMQNTLLRDADTNSMAHSIELRVPFVGRAMLEEAARTPGELHLGGGRIPKAVLRQAAGGFLSPAVLSRPKTGFSLPIGDWMYNELRDFCENAVDALRHVPCIDATAGRRLWNRLERDRHHTYWMKPLLLVALGYYADTCSRTYLDSAGAMKVRPRQ